MFYNLFFNEATSYVCVYVADTYLFWKPVGDNAPQHSCCQLIAQNDEMKVKVIFSSI